MTAVHVPLRTVIVRGVCLLPGMLFSATVGGRTQRFTYRSVEPHGRWVHCVSKNGNLRSVRVEAITRVHRTKADPS